MERQTPPSANPSGPANSNSPHPRPIHESTATPGLQDTVASIPSGAPQAGSPPVADAPAPHQKPETADRIETSAPSHQPLIPVLQPPAARSTPERTANLAARPMTASTLREQPSSPTRPPPPQLTMARPMSAGHPGSSMEKLEDSDSLLAMGYPELHRNSAVRTDQSLPPLPHARLVDNGVIPTRRQRSYAPASLGHGPGSRRSNTDWLADEKVSSVQLGSLSRGFNTNFRRSQQSENASNPLSMLPRLNETLMQQKQNLLVGRSTPPLDYRSFSVLSQPGYQQSAPLADRSVKR